ncbi:hypothetical protein ACG9ZJ_21190 [Acinetobacter sp. ULE_I064]|uniref:hypothetical protein n=1 Tax=Acinetobacter sp. ULE_I064 TaxID=3373071 RepID=UPI003AF76EF3
MDLCVLDFDLASKFFSPITTIILAVVAYHLWHKQKSKEVIAVESKELYKKIHTYLILLSQVSYDFEESVIKNIDTMSPKFYEFSNMSQSIFESLNIIYESKKDKKLGELAKNLDIKYAYLLEIYSYYYILEMKNFDDDNHRLETVKILKDHTIDFSSYFSEIKEILLKYALYKK